MVVTDVSESSPTNGVDRIPPSAAVPPPAKPVKQATAISKPASVPKVKKTRTAAKKPTKRGGTSRIFPSFSFEESLQIAGAIQTQAGGARFRRLTLFHGLNKSPDSGPSRMLVINSAKYGLTVGGYQAEHLELTPQGRLATDPEANTKDRLKARFDLAIANIPPFKALYDKLAGNKLPAKAVIYDNLREAGVSDEDVTKCADVFIVNAKYVGLLKTVAGAERLLSIEHVLEELPTSGGVLEFPASPRPSNSAAATPSSSETSDWSKICFYITRSAQKTRRRESILISS